MAQRETGLAVLDGFFGKWLVAGDFVLPDFPELLGREISIGREHCSEPECLDVTAYRDVIDELGTTPGNELPAGYIGSGVEPFLSCLLGFLSETIEHRTASKKLSESVVVSEHG